MQQYADIYLLQSHPTCLGVAAPIIRSTKIVTLEGSNGTGIMTCTGGCGYSF